MKFRELMPLLGYGGWDGNDLEQMIMRFVDHLGIDTARKIAHAPRGQNGVSMKLIEGLFVFPQSMPWRCESAENVEEGIRSVAVKRAISVWTIAMVEPVEVVVHNEAGVEVFRRTYPMIRNQQGGDLFVVRGPSFEEIVALMRECR